MLDLNHLENECEKDTYANLGGIQLLEPTKGRLTLPEQEDLYG